MGCSATFHLGIFEMMACLVGVEVEVIGMAFQQPNLYMADKELLPTANEIYPRLKVEWSIV